MKKSSTVQASTKKYSHWSCEIFSHSGGSGFMITRPCEPPVQCSNTLCFKICGMAMPSASVAIDRYSPSSRKAGRPNRKPAARQITPAIGMVSQYGTPPLSIKMAAV